MFNITSSEQSLSGFYYNLSDFGKILTVKYDIELLNGNCAFIYCEDEQENKLIPRTYIFTENNRKKGMIHFKLNQFICKIGILFWDGGTNQKLTVHNFEIFDGNELIKTNMNICKDAMVTENVETDGYSDTDTENKPQSRTARKNAKHREKKKLQKKANY
jgi:hypothetical protein